MNERLKHLLGHAYDEAVPETWTTLSSEQLGRVYEKFAELIVRECVEVVKWTPSQFPNDEYVKNIQEHFGVSE
jgi:hypothetical protein